MHKGSKPESSSYFKEVKSNADPEAALPESERRIVG
jgi:hypothetical protein